jgi:hypothetical protein
VSTTEHSFAIKKEIFMLRRSDNSFSVFVLQIALVTCLCGLRALAFCQESTGVKRSDAHNPSSFVGTWSGKFDGRTFTILKLDVVDHKIVGTISIGQINVGADGEVNEVTSEAKDETKILDPQETGDSLSFKAKDGEDVNVLELKLLGDGKAELKSVPQPSNIKPFKLTMQPK